MIGVNLFQSLTPTTQCDVLKRELRLALDKENTQGYRLNTTCKTN